MYQRFISFIVHIFFIISLQFFVTTPVHPNDLYVKDKYRKTENMVEMRDGCKLFTQIYVPKNDQEKYGIILERTPYSVGHYGPNRTREVLGPNPMYAREGFIFVYQDVRGKFKSEGKFEVMKPLIANKYKKSDTDESSDTYDTIEWLLKNIPNHNGRVVQWGTSYSGWEAVMGMIDPHPALKAALPQAPPADMWIGDDFHHNGAFRLMYTFNWLLHNARYSNINNIDPLESFDFNTSDGYHFFLDIGPLENANIKYFHNSIPTWKEYMDHGNYDYYWQKRNILNYLQNIKLPVLIVAGWFDAEDFYGPINIYKTIEEKVPENKTTLIVGPWKHSGWNWMDGDHLGDIKFGQRTAEYFRNEIELPFFTYHLKDEGLLEPPEVLVFETGSNQWKEYSQWPPQSVSDRNLYLQANQKLSFTPSYSNSNDSFDSFISDPNNPVPWSTEQRTTQGHLWMIEDQRFVAERSDVLTYQSDILENDLTIAGPIIADIYVSTTGTDADWIVKLIDVFPDSSATNVSKNSNQKLNGYQMLLAGEVFRSKYRNSFEFPESLAPDEVVEIKFNLGDRNHRFLKSHRIMVQLQSSWFPLIDRNPQKFIDIYNAKIEDFQKAEHRIYHSRKLPSHIHIKKINHNP